MWRRCRAAAHRACPPSPRRLWALELPTPPRAAQRERCQQHRSVSANAQGESVSTRGGSACQQARPSRRARVCKRGKGVSVGMQPCAKSLQSSYKGLYPQTPVILHGVYPQTPAILHGVASPDSGHPTRSCTLSSRKSTPPQNRQFNISISNSEQ